MERLLDGVGDGGFVWGMMSKSSLVIVGGGVFGLSSALELRGRGWRVTLLDQGEVPHTDAASTDISKVVRMDYGADEIYTEMGEAALDGWCRWNASWERPLFHADGFLVMTRDPEMKPGGFEHDSFHFLTSRGHDLVRLREADLARRHPMWKAGCFHDGYLNPTGGWAESERVMAQLRRLAAEAEIHSGRTFESWMEKGSRVVGVRTADGSEWAADQVMACLGAWTPLVLPETRGFLSTSGQPVVHFKPERTQDFRSPSFPVWGADIARTGWYGFPANAEGIVKVANHGPGTPIHERDQPRLVSEAEVERFREFVRETFPQLAGAPVVGTRQCWYCDSRDGHFWIDHHPQRPGLLLATGDSGHAFKFAPVLGGLIADVVERQPNPWAERFRWREAETKPADGARARSVDG